IRMETRVQAVRAALRAAALSKGGADLLPPARAFLREIEEIPCAWTRAQAAVLRAGMSSLQSDPSATVRALRAAIRLCEAARVPLCHALAEHALGRIL